MKYYYLLDRRNSAPFNKCIVVSNGLLCNSSKNFTLLKHSKEKTLMSAVLNAAIQTQLTTRVQRNSAGQLLCRRCGKVVPPDYSIVFWDPSNESTVWGPCCSDECICHLKICSVCEKDFVIDKEGEITHVGDGVWLCKHCIQTVEICPKCNRKGSLEDTPLGKMCKKCKDKTFFTCTDCGEFKLKSDILANFTTSIEMARWSHVINGDVNICNDCFKKRKVGRTPLAVSVCQCCGDTYPTHSESPDFCMNCISRENVKKCAHCNQYTARWDVSEGKAYCRTCFPQLILCSCCKSNRFFKSEGYKVKSGVRPNLVCERCYSTKVDIVECESCLSLVEKRNLKAIKGKKTACKHCLSKYNLCDACGQYHFGEYNCRTNDVQVCEYSYKPQVYFNGSVNDRVFFGFENEINYTEENYQIAKKTVLQGYPSHILYAKKDGSISSPGFEVVSHPMTLDFFNNLDLEPMYRIKPRERDTSCGLHVHISRTSFDGQAHLFKLTEFINDNKLFMKKIAGRDFNTYAREYSEKISKAVKGTARRERYHAINLTNKQTVEIRIFKSARNEYQLRYRIEFVSAILEYTRSSSLLCLKERDFKAWLKVQSGYPNLKKFLKLVTV